MTELGPRLPRWLSKEFACNAGDTGDTSSIPGSERSPGGEYGNPLQHSFLENPMDKGAWQATVHRIAELDMTEVTECACMHWDLNLGFLRPKPPFFPFSLLGIITQLEIQFLKLSRKERMNSSSSIISEVSFEFTIIMIRRRHEMEKIIQLRLDCMIQLSMSTLPISWVPGFLSLRIQLILLPWSSKEG